MLQQLNKRYPLFWQLPIYIVWAPMCICLLCVLSLPETPWHYARRGDKEASVRQLRKINKGVVGYDCEMEYEVIQRTLSHEKAVQEANKASTWYDILIGPNKVSEEIPDEALRFYQRIAPYRHRPPDVCGQRVCRSRDDVILQYLFVHFSRTNHMPS